MELQISPFRAISDQGQKDIVNLIKIGNEANAELMLERLENSLVTAWLQLENRIVGTATIKSPEFSYRSFVVEKAALGRTPENISLELGYVFVLPSFRNQGLALQLCNSLIQQIPNLSIFATTRHDNSGMKSILHTLNFSKEGNSYENRSKTNMLEFYFRNPII